MENAMTRRSITQRALGITAAVALLGTPTAAAFAQDTDAESQPRIIRQREILISSTDEPRAKGGWLAENVRLNAKYGFAYKQKLKMGDRPVVVRIRGPVMRKQKALGLTFKIDF
jgi:hypothetical protein